MAVFPSYVGRPKLAGIIVGMNLKDFFHCARRRLRQWHTQGWFCWLLSRCVPSMLSSGPDARHHCRYGPDGQLRGEILADMVLMVQTAANCGFSAVSRLSTSPSWFRGSSLWSLRPKRFTSGAWIRWLMPLIVQVVLTITCTVFGVRLRSTRCGFYGRGLPELFQYSTLSGLNSGQMSASVNEGFFGRLSWRGTEADSYGPDFVGPQSFSSPVDAQRRLPTVQTVVGPRFPSLLTR